MIRSLASLSYPNFSAILLICELLFVENIIEITRNMKKINAIRDKEQRLALNSWAQNDFVGSVIAGTGFGKSRVGILAIDYILKQKSTRA